MSVEVSSKANRREEKQEWPYVRWAEKEGMWKVDARTKAGGSRRFFELKVEAKTFAHQCRVKKENEGTRSFGSEDLAKFGKTVQHAIDFYVAHLRARERSIPVEDAVKEVLELRKNAGRDKEYLRGLSIRLNRFAGDHGGMLMAEFETRALNLWLASLPHAPATRNTFRRDLVTLFSFARDHSYCDANPAEKTDLATDVDKPAGILTVPQAKRLLEVCGSDLIAYVAIGLFAGLRAAELEKLEWSEVDLDGRYIEVTALKSKTRRRRLVPITSNLAAWISPVARGGGKVAPVGLRKRFVVVRATAGLVEWPHNAMRHSFGSYRLAQCQDAPRVSLEMGNSPQMVFAHYRELVKPADAERYWALVPSSECLDKSPSAI